MDQHNAIKVYKGSPQPFGVHAGSGKRLNYAVSCAGIGTPGRREDSGVILYDSDGTERERIPFPEENRIGEIRFMEVDGLQERPLCYNYYCGETVFHDPAARLMGGNRTFGEKEDPMVWGIYRPDTFRWGADKIPNIPFEEMVLYLVHPRGFTMHSSSGVKHPGTFKGIEEKIPYFKKIGITSLELMPSYEFVEKKSDAASRKKRVSHYELPEELKGKTAQTGSRVKVNYWGYTEGFYYAPKAGYSASEYPDTELKQLVRALHRNGLELILQFYFPDSYPMSEVINILRYWRTEYHVDGFHLLGDRVPEGMIAEDPMLIDCKLFYMGYGDDAIDARVQAGYRNLGVYHEEFQWAIRRFLRGDEYAVQDMMRLIVRTSDRVGLVNSVTSHNGFTLADLVSYAKKHNEANGENNRDGNGYEISFNCGEEGPTTKRSVKALRLQQQKNALLLLLLSQGVPRILSGDEFGFSHFGNNNPYCQDNEINWLDWSLTGKNRDLFRFTQKLLAFRREHALLHRTQEFRQQDPFGTGCPDLSYHAEDAWILDGSVLNNRVGILLNGAYAGRAGKEAEDTLYFVLNMSDKKQVFALPQMAGKSRYELCIKTAAQTPTQTERTVILGPYACAVYRVARENH